MITAEWNALEVGDDVLLHGGVAVGEALREGCVSFVDSSRVPHSVGVRMTKHADGEDDIVWPARLRLHRDPLLRIDNCAWCSGEAGRT
jgi:hypothetical protein